MKAVPYHHPVSTTRAVSHSRLPMTTVRPCAAESARGQQRLVDTVNERQAPATPATQSSRTAQRPRRNSGPGRHGVPATKINKASGSRNRIGLWLENIDPAHGLPPTLQALSPASSETWTRRRSASLSVPSSLDAARMARDPRAPRMPLADITSLVLAAESPSSFGSRNQSDARPQSSKMEMEPQSPKQRRPFSVPDLTGAVDMLTASEARHLLLMSARSDTSLANAIKEIAISRASIRSTQEFEQSYLADTFICDEDRIPTER
ncbi:hypothetical protein MYCTH_2307804 [Thermothelomyces thermophilus ATCC 42464]|uniref:Uncharacterized protein n=1 Tax=Thermothelomyces thermophilus (strain ATCC 42464 / BCRC 31852 / DSM 1799) TaxID=573729 RepID=G2QGV2_THET4|nr:uncharacterized protein MYCTH_2307804 [Thermothelomyces thermophilus ATCC 42464]AEO59459.1 hypothetical protein MYCTH_2307804 [Thermothelomyces thermophilus ATCC 42464]